MERAKLFSREREKFLARSRSDCAAVNLLFCLLANNNVRKRSYLGVTVILITVLPTRVKNCASTVCRYAHDGGYLSGYHNPCTASDLSNLAKNESKSIEVNERRVIVKTYIWLYTIRIIGVFQAPRLGRLLECWMSNTIVFFRYHPSHETILVISS